MLFYSQKLIPYTLENVAHNARCIATPKRYHYAAAVVKFQVNILIVILNIHVQICTFFDS